MNLRTLICACTLVCVAYPATPTLATSWTDEELAVIRSLGLGSLPTLQTDPTNPVADDPRAVDFGHRLFFDTRLSANGNVACVSCHLPELNFTDGRPVAEGIGMTIRNAPTLVGIAYSPWYFWDGRKDSLWSQALGPLENPVEHGTTRGGVLAVVRSDPDYTRRYIELFGPLPTTGDAQGVSRAFANVGRAIQAYERRLLPAPSRFDRYVEALVKGVTPQPDDDLTLDETQGLRAFMADNQGKCMRCHNGPLFTDNHFHNIGADVGNKQAEERGRFEGIRLALADEFNCQGPFGGGSPSVCSELRFAKRDSEELLGAFKTPTLRNLTKTGPYMHRGQYSRLDIAVRHYDAIPFAGVGKSELERTTLTGSQFDQIRVFLMTLESPIAAPEHLLRAPE